MKHTIYLIGPISGLSYNDAVSHFDERASKLPQYNILHPMLGKDYLRNELELKSHGYKNPISTNHAITLADFWRVDKSDILFADFTKAKDRVSIGTVAEISRGFAKNKLIITVLPDDNIHNHAFILEMSAIVFKTVEEAVEYLNNIL